MIKAPKFHNGIPAPKENERFYRELVDLVNTTDARISEAQAESTATSVDELRSDLNALIAKLKTSGQMET